MLSARAVGCIAALLVTASACFARRSCIGIACSAVCPRDAARESARCACAAGDVALLGACVPPAVVDAYCGRAARFDGHGCVFVSCADGSVLDAATGACLSRSAVLGADSSARRPSADGHAGLAGHEEGQECGRGKTTIVAQGRAACVPPDAACPRGTARTGDVCARPPGCPPGSLVVGAECKPIVTAATRGDQPRVDLGAWAALALGADGGPGSLDLCRPLWIRPDVFGLAPGGSGTLTLSIALAAPDQDLSRAFARVSGEVGAQPGASDSRPLSVEGQALAVASVSTLVEALRGLGGEASTAIVELRVSCALDL